jgi:signal transduction histidine kinase
MRARNVSWILDVAIVAVGLIAVAMLVLSTRLTSTTLDRNSTWTDAVASIELDVALSRVWMEADTPAAPRRARAEVAAARSRCTALLGAVEGDGPRASVRRLCTTLRSLAALRRPGNRYDAVFDSALRHADQAQHAVAVGIADRRRTLNRFNAGIVLLLVVVFAGMALVVSRRAKQLSAHNERLRRLDQLKDNVMAAVSHELRTPLTSTIGFLQTLQRSDLELDDERRRELLEIAHRQAERLARLVDDLLFFAQVETGKLQLRPGPVDLVALSDDAVRAAEPAAKQKGVALELRTDTVPPLNGDRVRLAQLLDNLVANAVKFTPSGGRVLVRAGAVDGRALLEVSDTGIGIPASEQPQLFDRFFRSSSAVEQAVPGIGLGLAIVKAIVEAHDGTVSLESAESGGTTVRVELPVSG